MLAAHLRPVRPGGQRRSTARTAGWASAWRWCAQLVELHGGSVEAAAPGSAGAASSRSACRCSPTAELRAARWTDGLAEPEPPAAPRRVLVVDDNVDAAESLRLLLRLARARGARWRYDGLDGAERGDGFEPDVVLLDIGLPGMDGLRGRAAPARAATGPTGWRWSRSPATAATTTCGKRGPPASTRTWSSRSIRRR